MRGRLLPRGSRPFHCLAGRVVVIGGSLEYCGAPYYAAMGALRTGSELAWVLCAPEAAVPIKSYSPELMVLPVLPPQ